MDVATLKLFLDVAQHASFSHVARGRNVDPSSVSRSISALETELGVRLIQRTTRNLVLTEAGASYFAQLKPLLEGLDHAHDAIASTPENPTGLLRMTASVGFGQQVLVPLIPLFQTKYPRVQLELLWTDANLDFVADRIDLAVRLGPSYRADVVGSKLISTRFKVVASPGYLSKVHVPRSPGDLDQHNCLLFTITDYRTRWLFRQKKKAEEVAVHGRVHASSALALRDLALAGMGPCLLADWLIRSHLESGELVDLFPNHDVTATTFDTAAWLLYPSRQFLPTKVRAMIEFLRQHVSNDP